MNQTQTWSFLGIPDHEGVRAVGGRIGAVGGPRAFREAFSRLQGKTLPQRRIHDCGEVQGLGADVEQNHRQAIDAVSIAHAKTGLSVVVGGGHDHGYSHLAGVVLALERSLGRRPRLGCINIDAHLDVRKPNPTITSGSPFYLAIERGVLDPKKFVEFGPQSHCNAKELWDYVDARGVKVIPMSGLRAGRAAFVFARTLKFLSLRCDSVVISLDLDSIASAFAPGVSAPQAEGFSPSEVLAMMETAGHSRKVASLGIFELNPEQDRDGMTAKLAASAAFHFLESRGV